MLSFKQGAPAGDALDLQLIALHFVMQREEVKSVPAGAPCLKVIEEVSRAYLGVNFSGSLRSRTHVSATTASTNCVVSRRTVS